MRAGSRPSPEGTRLQRRSVVPALLVARLMVRSVLWCQADGQQKDDAKKARRRTSQDGGRNKSEGNKSRPQRGGGVSLNLCLPGVSRWSGVTSHDITRYIVIPYPTPYDITRYGISRYCIHVPNFWDWYRDIVSRRNVSRYRTLFFAQLGAPSLVHQRVFTKN